MPSLDIWPIWIAFKYLAIQQSIDYKQGMECNSIAKSNRWNVQSMPSLIKIPTSSTQDQTFILPIKTRYHAQQKELLIYHPNNSS